MAGYDDYQTEEEYIAARKKRAGGEMDTKELVARLRRGCNCRLCKMDRCCCAEMEDAADTIERLERERDAATANARMYEATSKEAARGLECLSDIDDAWDAIGTRGNRKALTLAEQISSLTRELNDSEVEAAALRSRVARLEEALRAIDAKVVELGLAAQRKANGHKHEKFAAVRHSMRLIVSAALTEE